MFEFISFIWFFRTAKITLFYLYLWQLKEYHIGRFLDHFNTDKGRKLIFDPANILKIILLLFFPAVPLLTFFGTILLYLFEFIKTSFDFITKRAKLPVLTKKSIFLISVSLVLQIAFLYIVFQNLWYFERFIIFWDVGDIAIFTFWILLFDILAPVIVSIIVLLFQPLTVLARNRIIKRAKIKREKFPNLLVVGITGSYGKTSTKEFLASILSERFNVLKTKNHQNSEIGISQCILSELKPEHEIFIVEMGAYNRGGIKLLCDIVKPKIGILTGINEQHMATFGSQENIIKGKYELIESLPRSEPQVLLRGLPKDGIAFFNVKNKYC
ncbi:MAG: Mur ligase family protein, partial [Patescibacteria group bacterium]